MEVLLACGANVNSLAATTAVIPGPLATAVHFGRKSLAALLVARGACVNSALLEAAAQGWPREVSELADTYGASCVGAPLHVACGYVGLIYCLRPYEDK